MNTSKFAAVLLAAAIFLSCAFPALAAGQESSDTEGIFSTWESLTAACPKLPVHDMQLPDGTAGEVTWADLAKLAAAQNVTVVAYTAAGERIPDSQYGVTIIDKDQTFALVAEDGTPVELCRIADLGAPPVPAPTPEPKDSWTQICESHPEKTVDTAHLPAYLQGVPWAAFMMGAGYLPEFAGAVTAGAAVVPFGGDGEPISSEAAQLTAGIEPEQHFLLMAEDNTVLSLYDVGTFLPAASDRYPVSDVTWSEYCAQNTRLTPRDTKIPQDFYGKPWILFSVVLRMSSHYLVMPFDAQGIQLTTEIQKTALVSSGQHYALIQEDTGRLTALMNITGIGDDGPVPSPSPDPTGTAPAEPTLPPVIIPPAPTPPPSPGPTDTPAPSPDPTDTPAPDPDPTDTPVPDPDPTDTPVPDPEPTSIPEPDPDPTDMPDPNPTKVPGGRPILVASSHLQIVESSYGSLLTGLTAGHLPTVVMTLAANFEIPADTLCEVLSADGRILGADSAVGTGCCITFTDTDREVYDYIVVMKGDVTGSGIISISQVVRMAKALTQSEPLTGLQLMAADFNGNGSLDISDLTQEAALLNKPQ